MNQKQVIESLKKEASTNEAVSAILHVFALRKRARRQVTVQGLALRMKEEGFPFPKKDYESFIAFMASLGLGTLHAGKNGRPLAIKDIGVTLQSLGRAALGVDPSMEFLKKKKNTFHRIHMAVEPQTPVSIPLAPVKLTVTLNSKQITFPIQDDLSDEDVAFLVRKFRTA